MIHERGNSGRPVSGDWLRFRADAREEAFSLLEFSDKEIERYNLDDSGALPAADIDGENNPETYIGDDTGVGPTTGRRDARDLPGRG